MSEHSEPTPAATGGQSLPIDLIAGDPPVPITVWRTARSGDDQNSVVGTRLAYRLVAAYSRPGETIVDLTDTHTLAGPCLRGGRTHHKAWFTDASALIVGPATPHPPETTTAAERGQADGGLDIADPFDPAAWFGDDLTDPDLPPAGEPPTVADGEAGLRGRVSLVVAGWPLHAGEAANRVRLAWLLATTEQLLRRGGCLALVAGVGAVNTAHDYSPMVTAASAVGLRYLQHIVAVTADADGDRFTFYATDDDLRTMSGSTDGSWPVHTRAHIDVVIFLRVGGERRA